MNKRILVVDDEKDIRDLVAILLQKEGYLTDTAASGVEAVEKLSAGERFDMIIFDIIMPVMTGIEAAKKAREFTQCPILFLTAKSLDSDKVEAYDAGGDDYLVKPFSRVELLLRVKALLKRYESDNTSSESVVIDTTAKKVYKNGTLIHLTETEYEVLFLLYQNRGKTFSTPRIYESVWQEKYLQTSSNSVMVHILNLRKKLEDDFTNPRLILTVWGKGYSYAEKALQVNTD